MKKVLILKSCWAQPMPGCFSMKLAFVFQEAGITPESIDTEAKVIFEDGIKEIVLTTRVKTSGVDQAKFMEMANNAKRELPCVEAV